MQILSSCGPGGPHVLVSPSLSHLSSPQVLPSISRNPPTCASTQSHLPQGPCLFRSSSSPGACSPLGQTDIRQAYRIIDLSTTRRGTKKEKERSSRRRWSEWVDLKLERKERGLWDGTVELQEKETSSDKRKEKCSRQREQHVWGLCDKKEHGCSRIPVTKDSTNIRITVAPFLRHGLDVKYCARCFAFVVSNIILQSSVVPFSQMRKLKLNKCPVTQPGGVEGRSQT